MWAPRSRTTLGSAVVTTSSAGVLGLWKELSSVMDYLQITMDGPNHRRGVNWELQNLVLTIVSTVYFPTPRYADGRHQAAFEVEE